MNAAVPLHRDIDNHLLAALSGEEYQRLLPLLERVDLASHEILHSPGEPLRYIYFPHDCIITLVSITESGMSAQVGLVGREGMVGLSAFLGGDTTPYEAVVQVAGSAMRMRAEVFKDAVSRGGQLLGVLLLYTQALLTQTSQTSACNRLHRIDRRFARWLLSIHDRMEGDDFKLTHELMAEMLGVRRAGVTAAALKLKQAGLIDYGRGNIQILDREGLESAACECYEIIKGEFDRLLMSEMTRKMTGARPAATLAAVIGQVEDTAGGRIVETLREINSRLLIAGIREQEAHDLAEEVNRAKDQFLATLSHELRTPLTAMLGWARLLRSGQLDEATAARALDVIERNAVAQAQLIEDLLDVSRIIAGKLQLDLRPVNFAAVVAAAVDTVRPSADAKNVQLKSEREPEAVMISSDAVRLQQVVWNLLTNAVKFTPRWGSVEVRLKRVGAQAQLKVSDTGGGIAPEFLPQVFEPFRQADSTTMRKHGGLGLGLAIVQHLVELHGGTVRAESRGEGQGSTFTIELPLEADLVAAMDTERTGADKVALYGSAKLEGVRVLLVDDEPDTLEVLTTMLAGGGAMVQAVRSTREALRALRESRPDVLVSDIGMPNEDGYELIRRVRSSGNKRVRQIPAAALTAYASEEDRARVISAGYQMHVSKPVEPNSLMAVVARLAERN